MNEYLLQLMNKAKYPFSKSKNVDKRKKEQAKNNISRKERMDEIKLIVALALILAVTIAALILVYANAMT